MVVLDLARRIAARPGIAPRRLLQAAAVLAYLAAVPSLHAGQTLLITLFFFDRMRGRRRHLLWLYPLAMAFALVYLGEHYVVDVVLGWAYCLAVYVGIGSRLRPA